MIGAMAQQTLARPPATPARRRGALFWIGLTLVVAGLAVLGWVGWQLFGTNVVAQHQQKKIVEQSEQSWRSSTAGNAGATGKASGVEVGGADALIRIPRFGKSYVMPVQAGVSDR